MLRFRLAQGIRDTYLSRRCATGVPLKEPPVVGLGAGPDAREKLAGLYEETLRSVETIPAEAAYRVNVEKITRYRLDVVRSTEDVDAIEEKLGVGQIGEIIEQAQDELELIPHMAEWEPWQTPAGEKSNVKIELID